MSYQDLKFDGQLFALEKMVSERAGDRPELARYRLSLVIFLKFYFFIFHNHRNTDCGNGKTTRSSFTE